VHPGIPQGERSASLALCTDVLIEHVGKPFHRIFATGCRMFLIVAERLIYRPWAEK